MIWRNPRYHSYYSCTYCTVVVRCWWAQTICIHTCVYVPLEISICAIHITIISRTKYRGPYHSYESSELNPRCGPKNHVRVPLYVYAPIILTFGLDYRRVPPYITCSYDGSSKGGKCLAQVLRRTIQVKTSWWLLQEQYVTGKSTGKNMMTLQQYQHCHIK